MNPHANEQPLIPAFSPYEGEKVNLSLVFEYANTWMSSQVQCAKFHFDEASPFGELQSGFGAIELT
jgi:hypothetical protein